ncbi:MAG TPA: hypothetical protein VE621_01490, partial [Bryobacteraceae bacterium]|nr:hypothetical protein [Bryobacteraceae bacterium]
MATQLNTTTASANTQIISTVAPTAPASRMPTWQAIAPVAVAAILALIPTPPGLPHFAWLYFSIFAGVIV